MVGLVDPPDVAQGLTLATLRREIRRGARLGHHYLNGFGELQGRR